nr:hypothetical protein [Kitasatospora fiedleri]
MHRPEAVAQLEPQVGRLERAAVLPGTVVHPHRDGQLDPGRAPRQRHPGRRRLGQRRQQLPGRSVVEQVGPHPQFGARPGGGGQQDAALPVARQRQVGPGHRQQPVAARQRRVPAALAQRGQRRTLDPQAARGGEVGLVALRVAPRGVLADRQHAGGHRQHQQQHRAVRPARAARQLPAAQRRAQPAPPGGQSGPQPGRQRQHPQHQQRPRAQRQGGRRDQHRVDAQPAVGGHREAAGPGGELPVGDHGQRQQGQVGAGAHHRADHRLTARHQLPAAAPQHRGQRREQHAHQRAQRRRRPAHGRVGVLQRQPGQRAVAGQQPQQRPGQQRGQQCGGQRQQQRLQAGPGGEPAPGRAPGGEQRVLPALPLRDQVHHQQQGRAREHRQLEPRSADRTR